ncbi:MerR family transcriptional regulator [Amphibacillus jilinensis]|uniref:MerR family transcriptional regulator n=1 Tax=Amphibacillus jilinensis TaxID=1216008 RepID=UPI0002F8F83B|nr:MerR family transcriptional regulator [Amphibacillus jilinensis]
MRTFLTIGEVATLLNLSTSKIRFYEKKGLLKPHLIDDNGYRLYAYEELDTLEMITVFRKMNLSIHEIKDILDQKNTYNFNSILDKVEQQANEEITQLKQTLRFINKLRSHFTRFNTDEESVSFFPKRILYVIDDKINIEKHERELYAFVQQHGLHYYDNSYLLFTILDQPQHISCLFDQVNNKKISQLPTYELEAGCYVCLNFVIDSYDEVNELQQIAIGRCKDKGYEPVGACVIVEDFTTFLFSKTKIHLTLQVRVNTNNGKYFSG